MAASGSTASRTGSIVPPRTQPIPSPSSAAAHSPVSNEAPPDAAARIVESAAVAPSSSSAVRSSRRRWASSWSNAARSATPRTASSAYAVASERVAIRSRARERDPSRTADGRSSPAAPAKASSTQPASGWIQPSSTHPNATAAAAAIGGIATPANASSSVPMSAVTRASRSPLRHARRPAGARGSIDRKNHARRSASTRNVPVWMTIRSRYRATERPMASTRTAVIASASSATLVAVWARLMR